MTDTTTPAEGLSEAETASMARLAVYIDDLSAEYRDRPIVADIKAVMLATARLHRTRAEARRPLVEALAWYADADQNDFAVDDGRRARTSLAIVRETGGIASQDPQNHQCADPIRGRASNAEPTR